MLKLFCWKCVLYPDKLLIHISLPGLAEGTQSLDMSLDIPYESCYWLYGERLIIKYQCCSSHLATGDMLRVACQESPQD